MEKLTKENIQFIDTYLLNSEVIYKDIRVEMIDHVATAIEVKMKAENEDFYDTFKIFMVENKAFLKDQNTNCEKRSLKIFWNSFFKNIWSIKSLLFILLSGVLMFLVSTFDKELSTKESVRSIVSSSTFIVLIFYVIRVRIFMNTKFSSLFYSFGVFILADFLLIFLISFVVHSEASGILVSTLIIFSLLNFINTMLGFIAFYENKYELT